MKHPFSILFFLACASTLAARADSIPRPAGATFARGALFMVDGYAAGRPALDGFPVLVRLSAGSPSGFAYSQLQSPSTGADLVFVDMDGTALPFEIDTWDPSGTSLVWVRLPSMQHGTQFAMCWGSETAGKAVCPDDPWRGYAGVWHLGETAGGSTVVSDSTTNGLSGSTVSSSSSKTDGKIGRSRHVTTDGQHTPGLNSGITVDLSDAAKRAAVDGLGTEFTASMWVRVTADYNYFYLISRKNSDGYASWGVQTLNNATGTIRLYSAGTADSQVASPKLSVALGAKNEWHKIDFVWKADGSYEIYQDGANRLADKLYNKQPAVQGSLNLSLGGALQNGSAKGGRGLNGDLDEVRLRAFVPSADWVAADYAAQANPAFLSAGTAEDIDETGPAAMLSVAGEHYSGATARVRLFSLGGNAESATVRIVISSSEDFADPVWSDESPVSSAGLYEVAATGLSFGTAYWARATVTNDLGADISLGPVPFRTPSPGAPEGTAEIAVRGFTTLSALGAVTAFGTDATSATMRLEASTDAGFSMLAGVSAEVPATLGQGAALEIADLEPATEYRLRLRLANEWGVEAFVEIPATRTLAGPFDASGIGWTFSEDVTEVNVSFDVTAVFSGATGTATLYCDEGAEPTVSRGERTVDAPGSVAWEGIPFGDEPLNAKVVLVSEVGGATYAQTWTAVVDLAFKRPKRIPVEEGLTTLVGQDGTEKGPVDGSVFDGDFGTGLLAVMAGDSIVLDFTGLFDPGKPNQRMYVGDILVAHGIANTYSLYLSEDGTTWTPVEEAQGAAATGSVDYPVKTWVSKIKYVVGEARTSYHVPLLSELQVYGYLSDSPHVVSKWPLAWIYKANGTPCEKDSSDSTQPSATGGGSYMRDLFNGNFNDSVYLGPNGRLNNGSYVMLDFTSEMPDGWFVTEIRTGSKTDHSYSLYYSANGIAWTPVAGGTGVKATGEKTFSVNDSARYVKCVWDAIGGWTPTFNELQVWGMDPADVACVHASWTAWEPVEGSATCLNYGFDAQYCTVCGERAIRENRSIPPLGHDYVSRLDRSGKYRQFGRGAIGCSRCGFLLDCPEPVNLVTNRVDGEQIGVVRSEGLIRFTNLSVTSTGDAGYGVRPGHLINDNWAWGWNNYWFSTGNDADPHVDYELGTVMDLAWVDVSLPNATHVVRFYDVDDASGEETQLKQFLVARTDPELGDQYHVYRAPGEELDDLYGDGEFDELTVVKDPGIPANRLDENGQTIMEEKDGSMVPVSNSYNQYQRFTLRFYEQPVRHLRIRQFKENGDAKKPMEISELHPWGTVKGAGDLRYRKESLLILR